jgi:hypothetical protein
MRNKKRSVLKKKKRMRKSNRKNRHFLGVCSPVTIDGTNFDWPKNNGCVDDTLRETILKKGKLVDRFGSEYGKYVGEMYESYDDRAIPYFSNSEDCKEEYKKIYSNDITPNSKNNYHIYKILEDLPTESCQIKPHFGHGTLKKENVQYYLGDDKNILKLLEEKKICEVHHKHRPINEPINSKFICPNMETDSYPPFNNYK